MFGLQNFNESSEFDHQHAAKLLAHHNQELNKHSDKDLKEMLTEENQNPAQANEALEAMLNEYVKDDNVCKTYKLFNYVLK